MAISNKRSIGQALDEIPPALITYIQLTLEAESKGPRRAEIGLALQEAEVRLVNGKPHWDVQALVRMTIKLWGPIFSQPFDKKCRPSGATAAKARTPTHRKGRRQLQTPRLSRSHPQGELLALATTQSRWQHHRLFCAGSKPLIPRCDASNHCFVARYTENGPTHWRRRDMMPIRPKIRSEKNA